jgi:hypothetical protein
MSSDLQISDHPSIREALQKDEANILDLLKGILTSETERTTVLCLRGVAAQKFVNLVQDVCIFLLLCWSFADSSALHVRFLTEGRFGTAMTGAFAMTLIACL